MPRVRPEIRKFFDRYDEAGRDPDGKGLLDCFSETFLSLDPLRVTPVPREALLAALPTRRQMFASIGTDGLDLAELHELPLDHMHTLVRTSWTARFTAGNADAAPLCLASDFLLRKDDEAWRIAVYLNHADLSSLFAARRASDQTA